MILYVIKLFFNYVVAIQYLKLPKINFNIYEPDVDVCFASWNKYSILWLVYYLYRCMLSIYLSVM